VPLVNHYERRVLADDVCERIDNFALGIFLKRCRIALFELEEVVHQRPVLLIDLILLLYWCFMPKSHEARDNDAEIVAYILGGDGESLFIRENLDLTTEGLIE
jgi:hypothetical protein